MQPTIHRFDVADMVMSTMVMSLGDFNQFIDELHQKSQISEANALIAKDMKHIPMIIKGTATAWIFDKYNIIDNRLAIIVRGASHEVITKMGFNDAEVVEALNEAPIIPLNIGEEALTRAKLTFFTKGWSDFIALKGEEATKLKFRELVDKAKEYGQVILTYPDGQAINPLN